LQNTKLTNRTHLEFEKKKDKLQLSFTLALHFGFTTYKRQVLKLKAISTHFAITCKSF
jgi:hypothetical protein